MAIVNLVSNLRAYNPKFSDFPVTQVVDQPIPAEPNRTAPSNSDRRLDDYERLKSFLTSGKGLTFAAKQAGLDQAARGISGKERVGEAANTAARLANILLQVAPKAALLAGEAGVPQTGIAGEIIRYSSELTARFSSHPFLRYIEARGVREQIGNLLRADAPSLALRGKTIIPDNEYVDTNQSAADNTTTEQTSGIRNFFRNIVNNVRKSEAFTENIENNSTSLKSTFKALDGGKFNKSVRTGYVVAAATGSRDPEVKAGRSFIRDISVNDSNTFTFDRPVSVNLTSAADRGTSLNRTFPETEYTDTDYASGKLGLGRATFDIRTKAKDAGRTGGQQFRLFPPRTSYLEQFENLNNFAQAFDENVSDIEIKIITPPVTPAATQPTSTQPLSIKFPAYIESFTDSYNGNWNGTSYIGRAEQVYNYTGFSRDYNFSFKVASLQVNDLTNLYRRLNILASTTAPTYGEKLTFMRGTYVRLKIGDYLDSTPGFLTNISFSWNTTYPWQAQTVQQVKVDETSGEIGKYEGFPLVPHILDVSCNFTPVHNFIPQTNTDLNNITSPYITDGTLIAAPVSDPPPVQTGTNAETATTTPGAIESPGSSQDFIDPAFTDPYADIYVQSTGN